MRQRLFKHISFKGRASRTEFAVLVLAALVVLAGALAAALILRKTPWNFLIVGPLIVLPYLILLSAGVRRLHDLNWSGRFLVLGLNPISGPFILAWLALQPGAIGTTRFDLPPTRG